MGLLNSIGVFNSLFLPLLCSPFCLPSFIPPLHSLSPPSLPPFFVFLFVCLPFIPPHSLPPHSLSSPSLHLTHPPPFAPLLQTHIGSCDYKGVVCPNAGCGQMLLASQVDAHTSVCGYRIVKCVYCHKDMVAKDLEVLVMYVHRVCGG